jgi:hypothetical protein
MTTFDNRLQAELAKFRHDMEFEFKVRLRRNKLFALKIAERLGLAGDQALDYAKAVVLADFRQCGDDPILDKAICDLEAKGEAVDTVGLKRDLEKLQAEAHQQMMNE